MVVFWKFMPRYDTAQWQTDLQQRSSKVSWTWLWETLPCHSLRNGAGLPERWGIADRKANGRRTSVHQLEARACPWTPGGVPP